jgi:membrane associated rhomboid family serine protease
MTPTPVGMRCPECSRQKTKVHTMRDVSLPVVARVIIGICVVVWIAELITRTSGDSVIEHGALFGPAIADGEWWRIVTSGFLHDNRIPMGLLHIGFNMYLLYYVGQLLEPTLGRIGFLVAFFVSLLGGSLGALLLSADSYTIGASGAVFGLIGVALMELRSRGIAPFQTDLGMLLIVNLVITFGFSAYISVGGHLGGLAAGVAVGFLLFEVGGTDRSRRRPILAGCAGLGAALAVASLVVAASSSSI